MKIIGIVSEYNPFHNGHSYQVRKSVQDLGADGVVAIMSGNFVQRGFPAIFDKWLRAEMAVRSGVNLVIELPTYFATSSAEQFAQGSIELLNAMGVVTDLSFGSEFDDLSLLEQISSALIHPTDIFNETLHDALKSGLSFPASRECALNAALPGLCDKIDLNQSNTILGIEYLKVLKQRDSSITPFLVKRLGKNYNDVTLDSDFVSATAIRQAYFESPDLIHAGSYMPKACLSAIGSTPYSAVQIQDFQNLLIYALRTTSIEALSKIKEVNEGLENKLFAAGNTCTNYSELVSALKSKRYTMTRINRILLNVLLGINKETYSVEKHGYFRVLAFDGVGQKIIREIKKTATHPVITNINKHSDFLRSNPLLQLDVKATNIYHLGQRESKYQTGGRDFIQKPYRHME